RRSAPGPPASAAAPCRSPRRSTATADRRGPPAAPAAAPRWRWEDAARVLEPSYFECTSRAEGRRPDFTILTKSLRFSAAARGSYLLDTDDRGYNADRWE